ncbi:MAG: RNA polymerase sigma factor [Bacteroidia bacterium]|nr:RNA polymerase sigma factor [Bacteroidia bacterium]
MANTVQAQLAISDQHITQDTLLQRCLKDDRLAQKELYQTYAKAMYTLAFRITNNPDLAHDVLQDAFIEVFRDLKKYSGKGTIGSWIKTIVIRKAVRQHKFEQRFERFEAKHDVGIPYNEIASASLEKAILNLPEGYRTVFTLVEIEGYKHKEIAAMLNISESTSRTQLYHAKKTLREQLKGEIK